ncbi:hypothetical protein GCM10011506_47900 [Marivirga lumbricoides]|uniref:Uncharacterized protein n=1 Tax=Marivirga lumbricoides TaxID=1046115 RepID=A0ABQ1N756_9BACT|nr:hypothetical protein GCM10011506_47900 [Marivirga lumbricoides]
MEEVKLVSEIIQVSINELGSIVISLIGLLGILKMLKQQTKKLFDKES